MQLESVTPNTFFEADGAAADHPFSARIEAAHKIIGNHKKVPPSSASPAALSPPLPCPEATSLMAPFPQRHLSTASPSPSPFAYLGRPRNEHFALLQERPPSYRTAGALGHYAT